MRKPVHAPRTAPVVGPYSPAIRVPGQVWVSGQIGLTAEGALVAGGVVAQARQALENLKAILEAAGTGLEQVVKTTIYLVDIEDFADVNEVYAAYFEAAPPARVCVEVSGLPKGALVEIDAVALTVS